MTEHPSIKCPKCKRGAVDVPPDHDPFAEQISPLCGRTVAISASCQNDHKWMEFNGTSGRSQSGVLGTPGWAKKSPKGEA